MKGITTVALTSRFPGSPVFLPLVMYVMDMISAVTANRRLGRLVRTAVANPVVVRAAANVRASFGVTSPFGIGRLGSLMASICRS